MPWSNLQGNITNAAENSIKTKATEIKTLLPFLVNLTSGERKEKLNIGGKELDFINKVHTYAQQNPGMIPAAINMAAFAEDIDRMNRLRRIMQILQTLTQSVSDTHFVSLLESLNTSLTVYQIISGLKEENFPGITAIQQDLKRYFPRSGKKKKTTPGS